ncbi:MAG: DNA-3-methyladenine glycosylase II [Cenarchaeum symbiont of Oopsacas minuta]|nr:DNA-3-methyladenine glycosylase II [Cenarchaeum symbiont of Oopsacas minuta]
MLKAEVHLCKDKKMAKIVKKVGPHMIKVRRGRYESLVMAIITQQISGSAARSITRRFREAYRPARFPKPIDVANSTYKKLKSCGLSDMKIRYIKNLSKNIATNNLRLASLSKLSDERVIEILCMQDGIGRWTAEMFLIFTLGRSDIMPAGDLGVRKGVKILYSLSEMPSEKRILEIAEKWRPYRTAATWYLWEFQR